MGSVVVQQGGIGVAIWVAAVAKQSAEKQLTTTASSGGRSGLVSGTTSDGVQDEDGLSGQQVWRRKGSEGMEVELCSLEDYALGPDVISNDELMDTVKVWSCSSSSLICAVTMLIDECCLVQMTC